MASKVYAKGIDVSKWQGNKVNFVKAKEAGIEFVFIRIGCGQTKDKCFEKDYAAAVAAGLKVGAYFYSYGTSESQGTTDATRVLGWLDNRHLDFPVAYDIEDKTQKKASMKKTNSAMYNAFAKKLELNARYDSILYTGESFFNNYFDKKLIDDDIWIAKYNAKEPSIGRLVQIWQYSSDPVYTSFYSGKLDQDVLLTDRFKPSRVAIDVISLNPYPVPERTLKLTVPRQKGNDVGWMQWELYQKGYLKESDIDCIFGNQSKDALGKYQSDHQLLVDYKCGSATRYSMLND